jgi:hypothetical protein
VVAEVLRSGPFEDAMRDMAAHAANNASKAAGAKGDKQWVDVAPALALAVANSEAVVGATVMAWAARRLSPSCSSGGSGTAKAARSLQRFALRIHRLAVLNALVAELARTHPDRKRLTSELGVNSAAWLKPISVCAMPKSPKSSSSPAAAATAAAAAAPSSPRAGARGNSAAALLEGFDVLVPGLPATELVTIFDVQDLDGGRGRSLQVGSSQWRTSWVSESRVTTVEVPLLAAAARVLGIGVSKATMRVLDDRVGLVAGDNITAAPATTAAAPVVVPVLVAADRQGDDVILGAVSVNAAAEEDGGDDVPDWARRREERKAAKRLEKLRRLSAAAAAGRAAGDRRSLLGGFHAVELAMSYGELDNASQEVQLCE